MKQNLAKLRRMTTSQPNKWMLQSMKELQQLKERRKRRGIRRKKGKVQLLPKMI